jgi:hypothetical protein
LKLTFELYTTALGDRQGTGSDCSAPQELDGLRLAVLQQRARALRALYASALRTPLSERQRRVVRSGGSCW